MGLGILEDRVMEHVPGTTRYFDDPNRPQVAGAEARHLKCDTNGPVPIILVPQPSDDPADPLNWSLLRRDTILTILCLISVFATALGSILAANTLTLSFYFETTFTKVALLTGYFLLGVAVAGILFVPSARVHGKRHAFLLGTILVIASSAWAGASQSYGSLLGARLVQGFGTAPFEALVNAAVGDLYFVHERGKRMALTNLAVFGGAFFTPIVVGKITHTIGWRWTFYLVAIFAGCCLPAVFFFVPETSYRRDTHLNLDMASSDDLRRAKDSTDNSTNGIPMATTGEENNTGNAVKESEGDSNDLRNNRGSGSLIGTYRTSLSPFNGRKSDESYFKLLLRPFPLLIHPAIFWAMLTQGTMIGWTVFIGIILAAIFLGPPLWWDEVNTGYAYTGAFVGAVLGFVIAGLLADWSAKLMTRRNGGVYEPEFRLFLVIPQLIFGCTGLYGFGVTSANVLEYGWFWMVFFFALETMGMVLGAVASSLYIVDAHRDIAIEAFTCLLIFKNFFSFGLTFSGYDWIAHGNGVIPTFMSVASVQVVICLLTIPMYIFGKRNRSFFHRHDLLRMSGLR